ncbi:DUF6074 family protein [Rhizobium sp.]
MSCEIKAFPTARRRSRILDAVEMLNETHGPAANEAWKTLMRNMAEELVAMGVSHADMRQQVLEFQAAVQLEMQAQFERELMESQGS